MVPLTRTFAPTIGPALSEIVQMTLRPSCCRLRVPTFGVQSPTTAAMKRSPPQRNKEAPRNTCLQNTTLLIKLEFKV